VTVEIIVDGVPDILSVEGRETLGHLMELADEFAADNGRAVVRAKLDGLTIRPGPGQGDKGDDPAAYGCLELTTMRLPDYAADTLLEARKHLITLGGFLEEIADDLRAGRIPSGLEKLNRVIDGWPCINEAMTAAAAVFGVDAGSVDLDGRGAREEFKRVGLLLADAKDALAREDHVTLADILQYEMIPVVDGQVAMIQGIAKAIEGRRAAMH
jgi:hypothetical protein